MEKLNKRAIKVLLRYNPKTWVRPIFFGRYSSAQCDNNFTESFNASIIEFNRYKPIVSLLEALKTKLMERIGKNSHDVEKWTDQYSPNAILELYLNKSATAKCKVVYNRDDGFKVNEKQDRHIVNLFTYKCTC